MIASIILAVVTQFMFSPDGVTQGSPLRSLPSQGVSRTTGKVVIGLHGLDDIARMDCGWYRYTPVAKPDTNHYWRVTNYVFSATGTVKNVWTEYTPPVKPERYSKLSIIEKLEQLNGGEGYETKWAEVKAEIERLGLLDKWNACTYIQGDDANFIAAKPRICQLLNMSVKQLDDLLAGCRY